MVGDRLGGPRPEAVIGRVACCALAGVLLLGAAMVTADPAAGRTRDRGWTPAAMGRRGPLAHLPRVQRTTMSPSIPSWIWQT